MQSNMPHDASTLAMSNWRRSMLARPALRPSAGPARSGARQIDPDEARVRQLDHRDQVVALAQPNSSTRHVSTGRLQPKSRRERREAIRVRSAEMPWLMYGSSS
jgi:hypothetical protein